MEENNLDKDKKLEVPNEIKQEEKMEVQNEINKEEKIKVPNAVNYEDKKETSNVTEQEKQIKSEEKLNKKKKEKKSVTFKKILIRRIIFVLLFLIIAVGVTAYFIINSEDNENINEEVSSKEEKTSSEEKTNSNEKTMDLNETYDLNAVKCTSVDTKYKGLSITYIQIDGLKDKDIEYAINYNLKNDIEVVIDKALEEGKIIDKENFSSYSIVNSNFGNTISIYTSVYSYKSSYKNGEYTYETILDEYIIENYDLTTGNRLTLNDIYTQDTVASDIINSSIYYDFVQKFATTEMDEDEWGYYVKDYNEDIEENMLDLATKINNKEEINFIFDEQSVVFIDYWATVYYKNAMDKVVIYNKFKTSDSIFDGQYDALTNIPVLAKRFDYNVENQIVEEGKNYYIDFTLMTYGDLDDEVIEIAKNQIDEMAYNIKKNVNDSNEFFIANYSFTVEYARENWNSYDNIFELTITKCELATTKSDYNSYIKERILNTFRYYPEESGGELPLYDNLFFYYINSDYRDGTYKEYDTQIEYDQYYETVYFDYEGNFYSELDDAVNSVIYGQTEQLVEQ